MVLESSNCFSDMEVLSNKHGYVHSSKNFSFLVLIRLEFYVMFVEWIQNFDDKSKIKFLDESHFVPRFLNKEKVWGFQGKKVYTKVNSLSEKSSSVTLIVSLNPDNPLYYDIRVETNDQVCFSIEHFF